MFYTYILRSSKSGILYYGYTTDLKRRLDEHNSGKSQFTKGHMPWNLMFYAAFVDQQKAQDFELYLKSGSGKAFCYKRLVSDPKSSLAEGDGSTQDTSPAQKLTLEIFWVKN